MASSSSNPVEYVELNDLSPEPEMRTEEVEVRIRNETTTIKIFADKCRICNAKAFGFNYFVVSCNACKMFFRRVIVDKLEYNCRRSGKCYDNTDDRNVRPKCKACRFKKCIKVGMKYGKIESEKLPLSITNHEDSLTALIGPLLYLDSQREYHFRNIYTEADPSISEILSRPVRGFSGPIFGLEKDIPLDKWSFFGVLTTVEFLGSLDFMAELELTDKVILVKNFAMMSSFLASCFWCKENKYDRLVNPNGMDVYPDSVLQIPTFTVEFLNRIRKLLVTHLIEINITSEECVLTNIILFCNSALPGLTTRGQRIIDMHQKRYCAVLFKHCLWKYQRNGPARLIELISLGSIISTVFQDLQSLVTIFHMYMPATKYHVVINESFLNNFL